MTYWKAAGFSYESLTSYLKYSNIAAKTLRSVLVADVKAVALKREEIALKRAVWKDGKIGESVLSTN